MKIQSIEEQTKYVNKIFLRLVNKLKKDKNKEWSVESPMVIYKTRDIHCFIGGMMFKKDTDHEKYSNLTGSCAGIIKVFYSDYRILNSEELKEYIKNKFDKIIQVINILIENEYKDDYEETGREGYCFNCLEI